jgi:hypothetical protein
MNKLLMGYNRDSYNNKTNRDKMSKMMLIIVKLILIRRREYERRRIRIKILKIHKIDINNCL